MRGVQGENFPKHPLLKGASLSSLVTILQKAILLIKAVII